MATYYAWAPIRSSESKEGAEVLSFAPGDVVTADKLKIDDAEFQLLIDCRSVRTMKYPEMGNSQISPVEFLKKQASDAAAGIMDEAINSDAAFEAAHAANEAATGIEVPGVGSAKVEAVADNSPDAEPGDKVDPNAPPPGGDNK